MSNFVIIWISARTQHITNKELLALNEYILKDENNSFYDDFDIYDEHGYPLNFIEVNRFYDEIAKEMLK